MGNARKILIFFETYATVRVTVKTSPLVVPKSTGFKEHQAENLPPKADAGRLWEYMQEDWL